ncbi:hypothetical protein [Streptomyces sp. NPDC005780]|uniref:hypothetical protein n=1 Tax=Streptomyces sp. NPDC005780 TaxID=3364730 RepID=UPI00367F0B7F
MCGPVRPPAGRAAGVRVFRGGLLTQLLIDSSPGSPTAPSSRRNRERETTVDVAAAPVAPSPAGASLVPECLRDLYAEVDDALTAWDESRWRRYVAYRRLVNVASVIFRPKHEAILAYLGLDPDSVALEERFTRDMRGIGIGTGDLEVPLASTADPEKAGSLIRQVFETA